MRSDSIVRICYAAVWQYFQECGMTDIPVWGKLGVERQGWWRDHVERAMSGLPPRGIHEAWLDDRTEEDWVPRPGWAIAGAALAPWDALSDMYQTMYFVIQMNVCALTIGAVPAFAGKDVTSL